MLNVDVALKATAPIAADSTTPAMAAAWERADDSKKYGYK